MRKTVTELKVKASAFAVLIVGLVGQGVLAGTATDFVKSWPDQLEVTGYSLIAAGTAWLAGFITKNVKGKLADSTIRAAEEELNATKF